MQWYRFFLLRVWRFGLAVCPAFVVTWQRAASPVGEGMPGVAMLRKKQTRHEAGLQGYR